MPTGPTPLSATDFTVAIPVYNEQHVLEHLHSLVSVACARGGGSYEVLYVNDGSRDGTRGILEKLSARDPHVTVVNLSRNFGHPAALAAAVDLASGRILMVMDADLQDDPGVIPELLRLHRNEGAEVVYVVRSSREEGPLMRFLFNAFHRLIALTSNYELPCHAGSFGLVGPRALLEMRRLPERLRYFPGLRAFVGFTQVALPVPRGPRYDGKSRVGMTGLIRTAALAFFTQSRAPAVLFYILGLISLLASAGLITYAVVSKLMGIAVVSWASMLSSVAFFSGVIILGQAVLCEYLARIYEEVRQRPTYVVSSIRPARVRMEADDGFAQRA